VPIVNQQYRIVRSLGHGAHTIVLEVEDLLHDGVHLALKVHLDARTSHLLQWEFAQLRGLVHPNLARVHDLGVVARVEPSGQESARSDAAHESATIPEGALFLTQDLVPGRASDLSAAERRADPRALEVWAVAVAGAACRALRYVHARGVVHRDVKPGNIVVDDVPGDARLIDLGLSMLGRGSSLASGSVGYMAPEALAGAAETRSDLFALGATLYHLLAGSLPFGDPGDVAGTIRAIMTGDHVPLVRVAPWVSPGLDRLVAALLRPDPMARPASAASVLLDLSRIAGPEVVGLGAAPGGVADVVSLEEELTAPIARLSLEGPLIGRDDVADRLCRAIEERLEPSYRQDGGSPVIVLAGPAGVGKSAVVGEVIQRLQLRAAAAGRRTPDRIRGSLGHVVRALATRAGGPDAGNIPRLAAWLGHGPASGEVPDPTALCEEIAALLRGAADRHPLVVHLDGDTSDLAGHLLAYLHRSALVDGLPGSSPQATLAVLAEVRVEPDQVSPLPGELATVTLRTLTDDTIAEVLADRLGRSPPEPFRKAAVAAARGRPLLLGAFLSRALAAGHPEHLDEKVLATLDLSPDVADALASAVGAVPDDLRRPLLALAVFGLPATARDLAELVDGTEPEMASSLGRLWKLGWVEVDSDDRARTRAADLVSFARTLGSDWVSAVHRRAVDLLARAAPGELAARAEHARAAGMPREAAELGLEAGRSLLAAGDAAGACRFLEAAATLGSPGLVPRTRDIWRRALLAAGRYTEAVEMTRPLAEAGHPGARVELARTLRLAGQVEAARDEAERALRSPVDTVGARAVLARLELDRGAARRALETTGLLVPGGAAGDDAAALEEVAGLARLALGQHTEARAHFAECLRLAREAAGDDSTVLLARAHALLGMEAHHREDWAAAVRDFQTAGELARTAGHVHTAATCGINLASARLERGELGAALEPLRRAVATLAGVGRSGELAGALYDFASLLLALGDIESCAVVLARAEATARDAGAGQVLAYCRLLAGDLARRRGALVEAQQAYEDASARFVSLEARREEVLARIVLAEVLAERGVATLAVSELGRASALAGGDGSPKLELRMSMARARLALAGALDAESVLPSLRRARAALGSAEHLDLSWRADVLAARIEAVTGDHVAASRSIRRAEDVVRQAEALIPEVYLERWASDPDRRELRRVREALAAEGGSTGAPAPLRRLLDINRRLNSELRLGKLLDEIIDTIVELTGAERGFLLLRGRDGALRPRSARNVDRRSLESEELRVSRSIAEQVVATGEPVVTIDAQSDVRFGAASSVHALSLRSILAVPLRVKGTVVGAVYVDDRLAPGAFGDVAKQLAQDVADQAAIAIENARLLSENRQRQREIEALNSALQREVDRQRVELEELRRELDDQRRELATKYSYEAIVSRSAAMEKVFRVLDRLIDSDVPVVIQGESGTGKELVARAIHFNGPRKGHPFVTENCGAIPETLLESVLFGHVKGAFTGADRSRPGLFEVASGGTLLLDEVGEMSAAMQAKLLRVLQEGEVRPVGGDRVISVDVRVIASSNRDLGELVRQGAFRQDLYYRLNVITVRIPPLRERVEDIPLLIEHFLKKHGGGQVSAVDRTALRRLTSHGWPGNVRQLENEVMRAAVLADGVIREEHLSPELVEDPDRAPGSDVSDLDLRAHAERLERSLIRRALERFNANQSQAAASLGLSRYGLQKKMTRYGMRK
jgi:transcriptional regulator with GAF, ATPase, and Fis domain